MIVKNEAVRLVEALASVRGLVDEVVVLDTGSTDGTPELARSLGATVHPFVWMEDFAAARNASLAACSGDWILVLDADERMEPSHHDRVRQALSNPQVHGYRVWVRNYLRSGAHMGANQALSRNDGQYPAMAAWPYMDVSRHLRLFRRQAVPVYSGRIHELPDAFFEGRGLSVQDLDVTLHHLGKVDGAREAAKQATYLRLAKADAAATPGTLQSHWNVLQQALPAAAWADALAAAEGYLALQAQAPALVYLGGARALMGLGREAEAVPWVEAVLAQQPDHAPALSLRAEIAHAQGDADSALAWWSRAMEADPVFTESFRLASRALAAAGSVASARAVLEAGLDQNPQDLVLWEALVGLVARHEPERAPAEAWNALQAVPDGGETIWHQLVIHALLAQGDVTEARTVVRRGLAVFPGHPELQALGRRCGMEVPE